MSNAASLSFRQRAGVRATPNPPLPPDVLQRCRTLRRHATNAERLLWTFLRGRRLRGARFRRQYPIGSYIVDFYCHEARLVIELDGGGHAEPEQIRYDRERTEFLVRQGLQVLRFWDHDVLQHAEAALRVIWEALVLPSPRRERERP